MSRTAIPSHVRTLVFIRDQFACRYCDRDPMVYPGLKLEVHHIKPWSRGGLHALENLVLACFDCNHKVATQNIEPLFKPRSVRREEEHSKRIEEHTKNLADIHAAI